MSEKAIVESIVQVTPDTRQYTVKLKDDEFKGEAGQHTVIRTDEDAQPYSTMCVNKDRIILMIRTYEDGSVSKYMGELEEGEEIEVDKKLRGDLTLKSSDNDAVFISTGTGIVPMLGILHEYRKDSDGEATFLFGEKNREQLMYRGMLEQLEQVENLRVEFSLSREEWSGYEGYIQENLDEIFDEFDADRDYYICGVPEMVVSTKEKLSELGVPEDRIYSEGWEENAV